MVLRNIVEKEVSSVISSLSYFYTYFFHEIWIIAVAHWLLGHIKHSYGLIKEAYTFVYFHRSHLYKKKYISNPIDQIGN